MAAKGTVQGTSLDGPPKGGGTLDTQAGQDSSARRFKASVQLALLVALVPPLLCVAAAVHTAAAVLVSLLGLVTGGKTASGRLTLIGESAHLNALIPAMVLRYLLDGIASPPSPRGLPGPAYMSRLLGRAVTAVQDKAPSTQGGAGGHGTERAWLALTVEGEARPLRVFMKSRTRRFSESFFLNLFGVYQNELGFYRHLKGHRDRGPGAGVDPDQALAGLPPGFFPAVHCAEETLFRSDFRLVLEDLVAQRGGGRRAVVFPSLAPGQPHGRARLERVLEAQAALHAAYLGRPPPCVWRGSRPSSSPSFLQLVAGATLRDVEARFPGTVSVGVLATYRLFLANYPAVRNYWDRGQVTLVHGDAHVGNYYFVEEAAGWAAGGAAAAAAPAAAAAVASAGMYDLQCVAAEHPMRDVAYHVFSSVGDEALAEMGGDQGLVRFYLAKFRAGLGGRAVAAPDGLTAAERAAGRPPRGEAAGEAQQSGGGKGDGKGGEALGFDEAWFNYRLHGCWVLAAWIISAGAGDKLFETEKARFILGRISRACERVDVRGALEEALKKVA